MKKDMINQLEIIRISLIKGMRKKPKRMKKVNCNHNTDQIKVKGRGLSLWNNEKRALLGWEEEDYLKVNKQLMDYGKRNKDNFYRNSRRQDNNRVYYLFMKARR
jgi:hypothetical protein